VSLGLLAAIMLWKQISLEELSRHLQAADTGLVVLAFGVSALFHVLFGSHKLYLVLRAMGLDVGFLHTMRVVLGMGPLQLLLPMKGGEVAVVLYFWRHSRMPLGNASGALIFDRSLNFISAGFFLLAGLLLDPSWLAGSKTDALLAVSAVLLVGLFATPIHNLAIAICARVHPKLERMARAVLVPWRAMGVGKKLFFLVYSMLVVVRPVIVCYLLFLALDTPAPPSVVLVYTAVAIFAGHLPGPLMGMGAREGALVGLAAGQAGGETVALSIGLLLTLIVYIGPMLLGLPWAPALLRGIMAARGADDEQPRQEESPS